MSLWQLVFREMSERKAQLAMSFVAIVLGVSVIVSIRTVSRFSEIAMAQTMDNLGANILVMPKETTIDNYYRSDFVDASLPEAYVGTLTTSDLQGVGNLSPRLVVRDVPVGGSTVNLTGVLPRDEFPRRPDWAAGDIFVEPDACGVRPTRNASAAENAVRRKVIEHLAPGDCFVGSEVAGALRLGVGSTVRIAGPAGERSFRVAQILPQTGTVDDTRVLAHLHVVQEMFRAGPTLNVIEIAGCCKEISKGLAAKINDLLPAARVVTIGQIVSAQQEAHDRMEKFGIVFLVIICVAGVLSIANDMLSSVHERRREIGILLAIGATPGYVLRIFLLKALLLGVSGGAAGYIAGSTLAVVLGPSIAGVPVVPLAVLGPVSLAVAVGISLAATAVPAARAARIDPALMFREV